MTISMNLLMLAVLAAFCFTIGWLSRRKQLNGMQKRIAELEREMLDNHAEILELQKDKARFTSPLSTSMHDHGQRAKRHIA